MKSVLYLLCVAVLSSAPSAAGRSLSPGWITRAVVPRGGAEETIDQEATAPAVAVAAADTIDAIVNATVDAISGDNNTASEDSSNFTFSLFQPGDGHEDDPDGLPGRYIRMQKGNRKKAKTAVEESLEWRAKYEVDTILARPHPEFDLCNTVLPRCFIGRDSTDHIIHSLQPGFLDMEGNNVTIDDLVLHCIYVLEYCWNVLEPRPDQTMISVIDLNGLSFSKTKKLWKFVQQFAMMLSHNYPQRSYKTLVINAPSWFGALYRVISPLLRESTRNKISLLAKGGRQSKILREILGDEYASQVLTGEKIVTSPVELGMQAHVSETCPILISALV